LLQDTQVRTSAAAIFLCLQQQNEREGTKDSASHKHDSSNLGALPLESYDLVTKKKAPQSPSKEHRIQRSDHALTPSRMKKRAKVKLPRITKSETPIHALKVME